MSYSWSNDPTKSAIHGIVSRQASERGKRAINVFRCSIHVTANGISKKQIKLARVV
jgi:hypothetical protein